MDRNKIRSHRRWAVTGNFAGCALLPAFIFFAEKANDRLGQGQFPVMWLFAILMVMMLLIYTHIVAYRTTGLWKLTHAKTETLDERELQQTHRATGKAYGFYAVVSLVMLYLFIAAHTERLGPYLEFICVMDKLLAFQMVYIAHVMPGAIIAWREIPEPAEK